MNHSDLLIVNLWLRKVSNEATSVKSEKILEAGAMCEPVFSIGGCLRVQPIRLEISHHPNDKVRALGRPRFDLAKAVTFVFWQTDSFGRKDSLALLYSVSQSSSGVTTLQQGKVVQNISISSL